jgi:hypothetical protein
MSASSSFHSGQQWRRFGFLSAVADICCTYHRSQPRRIARGFAALLANDECLRESRRLPATVHRPRRVQGDSWSIRPTRGRPWIRRARSKPSPIFYYHPFSVNYPIFDESWPQWIREVCSKKRPRFLMGGQCTWIPWKPLTLDIMESSDLVIANSVASFGRIKCQKLTNASLQKLTFFFNFHFLQFCVEHVLFIASPTGK